MNTSELNKVLSDEIYKLRSGSVKPERVNAITKAASQLIATARLELMYLKLVGLPRQIIPFFDHYGKQKALPAKQEAKKVKRRPVLIESRKAA